jgi:hypothetical protein
VSETQGDEPVAGIRDERHSGVADESDFRSLLEGEDEFGGASEFIVFVVADERLANVIMGEELLGVAGVLAGDLVDFLEGAEGAKSDVFEIADGGADEIEAAREVGRILRGKLRVHAEESSTRGEGV